MGNVLQKASDETTQVSLEQEGLVKPKPGEDFIEVRVDLSKKSFNRLLKNLPDDYDSEKGFTPGTADDFTTALFASLVTGWSLDAEVSVEEYQSLKHSAAQVVDSKMLAHFDAITPSAEERKKSKADSK